MKISLKKWQISGFVFTGVVGVLLHFLYEWTNGNLIVAPFSAVNESIWEHMKLLFFPMFVFSLVEYRKFGKDYDNFWCVKLVGTLAGLALIPLIYYFYTGALGAWADWFNIAIFYIASGVAYYLETVIFENIISPCKSEIKPFICLCVIAVLFVILTFIHPEIPLFQDPSEIIAK